MEYYYQRFLDSNFASLRETHNLWDVPFMRQAGRGSTEKASVSMEQASISPEKRQFSKKKAYFYTEK